MFRFLLSKVFSSREKMTGDTVKPFLDHLEDLRGTIFKMLITIVVCMSVSFGFYKDIFWLMNMPLRWAGYIPEEVLYTGPMMSGFMGAISLCFYVSLVVSFPLLMYFAGEFILPAMTDRERKWILPALGVGFLLFLSGAAFCFCYIAPAVVKFMIGFNVGLGLKAQTEAWSYYKTVSLMTIVFGLLCQLPVVMITLHGIGIITYQWIKSTRAYGYGGIITLCAIVSPTPDIPSLVMFSVPLIGLYEICIWIIWFIEKRRPREEPRPAKPPVSQELKATPAAETAPFDPYHHEDPHHYDDHHYHDGHYDTAHYHRMDGVEPDAPKLDAPKPEETPKLPPSSKPEKKDGDPA